MRKKQGHPYGKSNAAWQLAGESGPTTGGMKHLPFGKKLPLSSTGCWALHAALSLSWGPDALTSCWTQFSHLPLLLGRRPKSSRCLCKSLRDLGGEDLSHTTRVSALV